MKRRQLLAGLGATVAGGTALGTGAFTTAQADRSVSVSVANEDQAYLSLSPTQGENATFVTQDSSANNEIAIDINDATGTQDDGDGVGLDSTYEFDNVFQIENQGTQEITVSIGELSDSDFDPDATGLTLQFYPGTSSGSPLHNSPITLGTGASQTIGLKIETEEPSIDDFSADATVSADAT
jgi:hypothetical protein